MNKETTNSTTVDTQKWEGNIKDMENFSDVANEETVIAAPIFILFAEYLGYVSQFNKYASDWCDGKVPEPHVQKIMKLEAQCIFRQMKKDYSLEDVKYYYESYYPLILKEYVDKLESIIDKK